MIPTFAKSNFIGSYSESLINYIYPDARSFHNALPYELYSNAGRIFDKLEIFSWQQAQNQYWATFDLKSLGQIYLMNGTDFFLNEHDCLFF